MFKKGKKKQSTKFDDDVLGLDSTPTETDKTEDSDASSLREKVLFIPFSSHTFTIPSFSLPFPGFSLFR